MHLHHDRMPDLVIRSADMGLFARVVSCIGSGRGDRENDPRKVDRLGFFPVLRQLLVGAARRRSLEEGKPQRPRRSDPRTWCGIGEPFAVCLSGCYLRSLLLALDPDRVVASGGEQASCTWAAGDSTTTSGTCGRRASLSRAVRLHWCLGRSESSVRLHCPGCSAGMRRERCSTQRGRHG